MTGALCDFFLSRPALFRLLEVVGFRRAARVAGVDPVPVSADSASFVGGDEPTIDVA
ncbi:MAG: hypothetical protein OER95_09865 [Acidimicrobiia bacterium]|nr:hypothetical protein [Acidimicrobiia bacterium]